MRPSHQPIFQSCFGESSQFPEWGECRNRGALSLLDQVTSLSMLMRQMWTWSQKDVGSDTVPPHASYVILDSYLLSLSLSFLTSQNDTVLMIPISQEI